MSKVGISPAEAQHGFSQQAAHTDELRVATNAIGSHVESLAFNTYQSATTMAAQAKWDSQVRPQLESLCNESDHRREGGVKAVAFQQHNQDHGAQQIHSI
jgi:hypothetical protein